MKVIGSCGDVFQSWLTSSRLVRRLVTAPIARPTPTRRRPRRTTIRTTWRAIAAERHPNRNLARLLRHRVGQDAIDAERDEDYAGARKDPEHQHAEPWSRVEPLRQLRLERVGLDKRDLRIDRAHLVTDRGADRAGSLVVRTTMREYSRGRRPYGRNTCGAGGSWMFWFFASLTTPITTNVGSGIGGGQRCQPRQADLAADRVEPTEVPRRERLVDDRDVAPRMDLTRRQLPSGQKTQAKGFEQRFAADLHERPGVLLRRRTGNLEGTVRTDECRQPAGDRNTDDPGKRLHAVDHVPVELPMIGGWPLLRPRKRDARHEHIPRVEPQIDADQLDERPHQEPRAEQQHDRERDLRDDEAAAHPRLPAAGRAAAPADVRPDAQIPSRALQRREEPETRPSRSRRR